MIDYLIIGSGLAGISFAEVALRNDKSILVLDNNSQNSSRIAGGLYNPVILKRFSEVWQAQEQLVLMNEFYALLEKKLECTVDFKRPILRKFFSVEEQNNWFIASDKINLSPFLSTKLIFEKFSGIDSPFGYGEVLQTGYVDTALLLRKYRDYLIHNKMFQEESFDYEALQVDSNGIRYKDIQAKHIVFAEGFGMHGNPYFKHLPLDGTKGELFVIRAPNLRLDVIVNTSVFILPLGNDLFKVGATYNWKDKTDLPTPEGKTELVERIKEIITCDFEIVAHFAGVRPTVKDRRPLVGTHQNYNSVHILNGLGTRGVMLGPAMAKALFDTIENKIPLDTVIDINRFVSKGKK
ncbi:FAD-binding oxidoreductase [Flavobacterium sp. LS1P28]|uniref:FAD-binding oxidoreductase n=1 Tax=Flavobacterium bomense TaxID=2497483 RepID=A0A3S0PV48_9FLAO|nr:MULTISPECIES: FAD-dependent oxidoreductase [Flavobacterium]RTY93735.1 FAD-binding oxidoreductase [Flavobacterium sp. GSN2]RTY68890.1 FAD-binding oxidoreductase [Flavobacterium sp. LB2P53]RTY80591.1 FAD-binding oxidoreductase [Flavobacterium sp. LS1P28]RTY90388.1 FAD-binding oxidoreductase [Flavobacterium sp. RSP46]RTZ03066.1 FAD-binding oxidoreductase [Flavobacterium bomense]